MLTVLLAAAITVAAPSGDWPRVEATLHGSLGPVTRLHRPDGPAQAVAVLHTAGERDPAPVLVILGAFDDVRGLHLAPGAHVVVRGRAGFVAGRRVLFAARVERARGCAPRAVASTTTRDDPPAPPARAALPSSYEVRRGELQGMDEVRVKGRRLLRVRLARQVLLLQVRRWAIEALRLRPGDRLEVAGRLIALGARPVIVVDQLRAGDDPPLSCRRPVRAVEQAITVRRRPPARAVDHAVTRRHP